MHFLREAALKRRRGYAAVGAPEFKVMPASTYALLAIPALFDLAATALCMFGLTYIAVSVYQMLRGSAIVFVAVLKHFVLGDKLAGFMWARGGAGSFPRRASRALSYVERNRSRLRASRDGFCLVERNRWRLVSRTAFVTTSSKIG